MVRQRIYGILAGYEDQNDHDTLRYDPIFQLVCDRLPEDGQETATQPTLSRFENAIQIADLFRLREWMVDQFLDSFKTPPMRLTFDLDGFDDPAHGNQQLTLFDGYRKQNQYFPLIITNAETGLVVMIALGTAPRMRRSGLMRIWNSWCKNCGHVGRTWTSKSARTAASACRGCTKSASGFVCGTPSASA